MKPHIKAYIIVICLLLWVLTPLPANAGAAGVDLIFLIDQSGSMMGGGKARHVRNDPFAKRIEAVRVLQQRLVESAVAGWHNRLSIIEFGGRLAQNPDHRPQVTVNRLDIPPLAPGGDSNTIRRLIRDGLAGVQSTFRGDTDHADALRLAVDEARAFQNQPPAVTAGGKPGDRRVVVVLITDGAPYAEGVPLPTLKTEIEARTRALTQSALAAQLIVFGLKDKGSRYWDDWGPFWERLASKDTKTGAGYAYELDPPEKTVDEMIAVLSELIPPVAGAAQAAAYTAPAYLRGLDFTINFFQPGLPLTAIDIRNPDDKPLDPGLITSSGRSSASATAPHPQPGLWRLAQPGAPYSVTVTPRYETATLVEPRGPVGQNNHIKIRYQLSGAGPNGLFQEQAGLPPVQFSLTLISPSGKTQMLPMQTDGIGHAAAKDVLLDETGNYQARFKGTTTAIDGNTYTIYESAQANGDSIAVNNAAPLELRLEAPAPDSTITLFNGAAEVPVRLVFYDGHSAAPLAPQTVLQAGVNLQLDYLGPTGKGTATAAPLQVTAQGLETRLPIAPGHTRWDYLLRPGQIRLQLSPDNFWQPGPYYFTGISGGQYLLSAPLRVRESWLSLWPLPLALAGLVGLGWAGWWFGRPWLMAWRDRRYQQAPRLVFKVRSNPSLTKAWSLKGVSRLAPTDTLVELDRTTGETWTIENFKIVRLRSQGKEVAIKLTYRPKPEKLPKETVKLRARDDTGTQSAQHLIKGLEGRQQAVFILFAGINTA